MKTTLLNTLFLLAAFVGSTASLCATNNFECEWWWNEADKISTYVDRYKHIAIAEMDRSGIPASIKMAQGILESGSGESELATVANNHFGIKCGGDWLGFSHYVWDDEPQKSCFRVYISPEQSYIAHSEFLRNPAKDFRYGFLFQLDKTDYKAWSKGLQSSGYATSKTYAEKLISLIERYELYKLDHLTLRSTELTDAEIAQIFEWQSNVSGDTTLKTAMDTLLVQKDPFNTADTTNQNHTVDVWADLLTPQQREQNFNKTFKVNNLPVVIAQKGDDLAAIALRHGVSAKKLLKYNELKQQQLQNGQYIFLKPKAKKSSNPAIRHIVREGQTMYDVAQFYGLRLSTLQRLNPRYKKEKLSAGVQLLLK
jgi:LysM repeat protein